MQYSGSVRAGREARKGSCPGRSSGSGDTPEKAGLQLPRDPRLRQPDRSGTLPFRQTFWIQAPLPRVGIVPDDLPEVRNRGLATLLWRVLAVAHDGLHSVRKSSLECVRKTTLPRWTLTVAPAAGSRQFATPPDGRELTDSTLEPFLRCSRWSCAVNTRACSKRLVIGAGIPFPYS